ncbi:phosphate transport system permease protein [Allocatelliglobosispora scoriae]|uniref:Phosphate transport system permease protein PstA n=1 Tax=Allocatelliglobosispora scoriae TaxID=643052 RepID=A0A841C1A6_9ACTN|nr:phosphate ABC transporter permease PstA [Allocatelliglobosispora scoriae]MBB5872842.1 phosphate transport system permease protein [Allocatelliglobosispora scoriae]
MSTDALVLKSRKLPSWAPWAVAVGALALAYLGVYAGELLGGGIALTGIAAVVLYLVGVGIAATVVEGRRSASNRVASSLIYAAFALALLPLASVIFTVVDRGRERLDADFFTHSMQGIIAFDANGGIYHAMIGTLEQVGIAVLITVPLGIAAAIYIVEYGRGKRLATAVRFFVDVMTGIPSIVAGLFILAFWVLVVTPMFSSDGKAHYSGFAAALALSVLMLPTITRSCEEMIRLVPDSLREGAYALGIPRWKTITKIVLPTALPGIVTGIMLAIARAAGETAPVLLVAGGYASINTNPFEGNQASLATYIYDQISTASQYGPPRAWSAALTLVVLVLTLTVAAKLLASRNKLTK